MCAPSPETQAELARLRRDLAARELELRELRAQHRDQIRSLEDMARNAERAKAKLRRRATRADTATLLADVEVLMLQERAAGGGRAGDALLASAQELLESASAAFARGDYAVAFDRADQAWHTVTAAGEERARAAGAVRARGEVPIEPPMASSVLTDTLLRQQPGRKAPVVGTVKESSPVVASARKQEWTRVLTADGRAGWIYGPHLAPR